MKVGLVRVGIAVIAVLIPLTSVAQEETVTGMLSIEGTQTTQEEPRVTAVYGMSADDYLPATAIARKHLKPRRRSSRAHPTFNLPDAFYFIGGPVFIFLFLRVLVIFLNGFEEKRREELRTVAREVWDVE